MKETEEEQESQKNEKGRGTKQQAGRMLEMPWNLAPGFFVQVYNTERAMPGWVLWKVQKVNRPKKPVKDNPQKIQAGVMHPGA